MMPAYSRDLINRRNRGDHPTDVFISIGWPSDSLREHVRSSPFAKNAAIIGCVEAKRYDYRALAGLSCIVWHERDEHEPGALEIATMIQRVNPLRLVVLNALRGSQTWFAVANELQVAA